jgi:hypothetical protein
MDPNTREGFSEPALHFLLGQLVQGTAPFRKDHGTGAAGIFPTSRGGAEEALDVSVAVSLMDSMEKGCFFSSAAGSFQPFQQKPVAIGGRFGRKAHPTGLQAAGDSFDSGPVLFPEDDPRILLFLRLFPFLASG